MCYPALFHRGRPVTYATSLNQERHDIGEMYGSLFAVGKTGHTLTLHDRLTFVGYPVQNTRRVTDRSNRLAGVVESFDQGD